MSKILRAGAVITVFALLAGCATIKPIPYDRQSAHVTSIAVLEPSFPKKATVYQAADVGKSLGLIGALVDSGIQSNREGKLADVIEDAHFSAKGSFLEAVDEALQAKGYTAVAMPVERAKTGYLKAYPESGDGTDAYLDIVVYNYGYLKAGIGGKSKWRPHLDFKCRLIRVSDKAVLMESYFSYNPLDTVQKGVVTIAPDPDAGYDDVDALIAGKEMTVNAIHDAFVKTTAAMGTLLQ